MTKAPRTRQDVLIAFASAHPEPSARDVVGWTRRFPAFKDDLAALARTLAEAGGIALEGRNETERMLYEPADAIEAEATPQMTRTEYEKQRERAIALAENVHGAGAPEGGFIDIVLWYGTTLPDLADVLGIDRAILSRVAFGKMDGAVGPRLIDALACALETGTGAILSGLAFDLAHRDTGGWVNPDEPLDTLTYLEAVEASSMSADRQAFWIDDGPYPRWERPHRSPPTGTGSRNE